MKSIVKFSLLALFCLSAEAGISRQAIAGTRAVTQPNSGSSGISDTFSNRGLSRPNISLSARIINGINNRLNNLQRSESVSSIDGQGLPLSPAQLDGILAAVLDVRSSQPSLQALEQQIANETGLDVKISLLGTSPADLTEAISAANALIMSLDSQQLAAAIKSPTFMALLELLNGGNEALSARNLNMLSQADTNDIGLLKMGLAR